MRCHVVQRSCLCHSVGIEIACSRYAMEWGVAAESEYQHEWSQSLGWHEVEMQGREWHINAFARCKCAAFRYSRFRCDCDVSLNTAARPLDAVLGS